MQVFVRSEAGKIVLLNVPCSATTEDVVAEYEKTDMAVAAPADRYLWYGGVPLRPHCPLQDHGVHDNATLNVCVRVRGGCFIFSTTLWMLILVLLLLGLCTCGLSIPVALSLVPIAMLLPLCCL